MKIDNCPQCNKSALKYLEESYYCSNCGKRFSNRYYQKGDYWWIESLSRRFLLITYLFLVSSTFYLLISVYVVFTPEGDNMTLSAKIGSMILLPFLLLGCVWLLLDAKRVYYKVMPTGIAKHTILGKEIFIRWNEIRKISFNDMAWWLVIKSDENVIRLSPYAISRNFADRIIEMLPEDIFSARANNLLRVRGNSN